MPAHDMLAKPGQKPGLRSLTAQDREFLDLIDSDVVSYLGPMIQISGVCNLKCTMCGGARDLIPGKFMDKSLFVTICDKLLADDIHGMIIAGAYGEPFLHPQIFEFLEHAKSRGFKIVLSTHGNNLDEERIKRLAALELMHVQFSFCGYDAESYERIYKGGKFDKAVANLGLMKRYLKKYPATEFLVNGVCDRDDPEMARRTHDLLTGLGIESAEIRIILPHNYGGMAIFDDMQQYAGVSSFKPVEGQHLGICKVLAKAPGILWDGRISACGCLDYKGTLEIGNIKFMSMREARKSDAFKRIVESFRTGDVSGIPLCDTCDVPYGHEETREFEF